MRAFCIGCSLLDTSWNVMAHAQKPDFVFRRNGRVHLNWQGRQFSRLLAAEVCASVVVMLDTPCFEVVWRVLATHSIRQFLHHFPSRASLYAIPFQLESTSGEAMLACLRAWLVVLMGLMFTCCMLHFLQCHVSVVQLTEHTNIITFT